MEYRFADQIVRLNPSAIREILKYSADPEVIPLAAGNPAPEAFPVDAIREISSRVLAGRAIDALQYSTTEGYSPLRSRLKAYMKEKHGVGRDFDELLVTSGAQQALELLAKALVNPGDVVLCEAPSFVGALNAFRSVGARLVGVPLQSDGIDVEALEAAMKANPNAKFLYTIPNFQNPAGITMSMDKRRRVYALAREYGILVAEDNPYGDLRYSGKDLPSIKSLDEEGVVMYTGTFSKVISPGLRVGYAIAPKTLLQKMIVCKQGEDVHTNIWSQILCDEFMAGYDYEAHLEGLRALYRVKAEKALSLIEQHLVPAGITYDKVEGGLFIWCHLPEGVDMPAFCTLAVKEHKVAVVPGNAFMPYETDPCQSFRINFSTPSDEALERGLKKLGEFAREYLKR
ncbi:MAG TPA: PLP-dependent aminotransferase family protein [Firmicutes bacterium]|nr:PLP-dependent aminotransferase family protein [Bacillota bacterium]